MSNALEISHLTKNYNKFNVFKDFSLEIPLNKTTGLIGPNGCGKTTLLQTSLGFTNSSKGTIKLLDKLVIENGKISKENMFDVRKKIGYIPDEYSFHEYLTIREYLELITSILEIPKELRNDRVERIMKYFTIERWADRLISTLSRGTRQKLLLSSIFIGAPSFLIMDEPLRGLDYGVKNKLIATFDKYKSTGLDSLGMKEGGSILLSSHLLTEIDSLCDHVVVLDIYGELAISGPVKEVKEEIMEAEDLKDIYLSVIKGEDVEL